MARNEDEPAAIKAGWRTGEIESSSVSGRRGEDSLGRDAMGGPRFAQKTRGRGDGSMKLKGGFQLMEWGASRFRPALPHCSVFCTVRTVDLSAGARSCIIAGVTCSRSPAAAGPDPGRASLLSRGSWNGAFISPVCALCCLFFACSLPVLCCCLTCPGPINQFTSLKQQQQEPGARARDGSPSFQSPVPDHSVDASCPASSPPSAPSPTRTLPTLSPQVAARHDRSFASNISRRRTDSGVTRPL